MTQSCIPWNTAGDPQEQSYVGIFYSVRKSGESVTHPRVRVPNFRQQHMAKLIRGCLTRFSPSSGEEYEVAIHPGDVYCIGDGFKHGLQQQLMSAFRSDGKTLEKNVWLNFHEYDETDLRARKAIKALGGCHQVEFQYNVTSGTPSIENRQRVNFKGATTWFDKLGPLPLPPYEEVWQVQFKTKKAMMGTARALAAWR